MEVNAVIRTGVTFSLSQDFKKIVKEEARIMADKEQNKQNKVLLILVRVKKKKTTAFYDLTGRHCFQGKLHVLYLIFFPYFV